MTVTLTGGSPDIGASSANADHHSIWLGHFENILPVERAAINLRRAQLRPKAEKTAEDGKDKAAAPERPEGTGEARGTPGRAVEAGQDPQPKDATAVRSENTPRPGPPGTDVPTDTASTVHLLKPGEKPADHRLTPRRYVRSRLDGPAPASPDLPPSAADVENPDGSDAKHPRPEPCNTIGLSLSGGGIRSASFCLGALQALNQRGVIDSVDYLSTVSGGGYIGTCMTACMSRHDGAFPFDGGDDVADNERVGHLRNYSNYLLPRGHSGLQNVSEAAAVILRGLIVNALLVLATLLLLALLTKALYPGVVDLGSGGLLSRPLQFVDFVSAFLGYPLNWAEFGKSFPFGFSLILSIVLTIVLVLWVVLRSLIRQLLEDDSRARIYVFILALAVGNLFLAHAIVGSLDGSDVTILGVIAGVVFDTFNITSIKYVLTVSVFALSIVVFFVFYERIAELGASDTRNPLLSFSARLLLAIIILLLIDSQPILILHLITAARQQGVPLVPPWTAVFAVGGAIAIALLSSQVGHFLKATQFTTSLPTMALRVASRAVVVAAALVLPAFVLVAYLYLSAWVIAGDMETAGLSNPLRHGNVVTIYLCVLIGLSASLFFVSPNAYSLHQIYRDRLSYAFLSDPKKSDWDRMKLSDINTCWSPYHIINTAVNVQRSKEANRRGRDADFFSFTKHFVGSDLTLYAPTRQPGAGRDMERVDPSLDLAAAMATSGAAVSANMGSDTLRLMSPSLALLNIRLGYWLRNPRSLAEATASTGWQRFVDRFWVRFSLLLEMLNLLDERSRHVYLTDGGHIENLGVYELLKRGCELIIAVDAECDPGIECPSLLRLERYARIDLGARIDLPWEKIAKRNNAVNKALEKGKDLKVRKGPHCAVGRILYQNGAEGLLVYIKASLSGDEKDYVLGYKKRYPRFPHETTGDQFFSEEQLEVYRALGFHSVIGFFSTAAADDFAWSEDMWACPDSARAAVFDLIPTFKRT